MKQKTHPTYFQAKVTCACGNTFVTGSTVETISVDVCSKCHPFYTGQMKFVDTMGRVEKFQKKQKAAQVVQTKIMTKKREIEAQKREEQFAPKTLREMLLGK